MQTCSGRLGYGEKIKKKKRWTWLPSKKEIPNKTHKTMLVYILRNIVVKVITRSSQNQSNKKDKK